MSHPAATGATDDRTRGRRGTPWWLWLLIALAIVALLLIGLTQCGGGNDPNAGSTGSGALATPTVAAAPAPGSAPAPNAAAGSGAGAGNGSVTVDGAAVSSVGQVAGPGGELTSAVGKTVTARGVVVQSVPADEGFWLGPSETDRVWVQLGGTGESGYVVRQGDRVEFTGRVVANDPGFAARVGVDSAEGADQLTRQAAHIAVAKSDLRKSAG